MKVRKSSFEEKGVNEQVSMRESFIAFIKSGFEEHMFALAVY